MNLIEKIKSYLSPEVREIYLVEIIYKNGQRVSMWCSGYSVRESNLSGELVSLSIYAEYSNKYPSAYYGGKKALYLGVKDISSFWQIGSMEVNV
jgi:hypothetical protein